MKTKITFLLFALLQLSFGQITYESTHFASIGDSYTVSQSSPNLATLDFEQTGAAYSWDYSTLSLNSQENINWLDPNNSGYKSTWCLMNGFIFNCNTNFNEAFNRAILEAEGLQIGTYGLENVIKHYKLSTTSLTNKMLGASITIGSNSVPLVVSYSIPDIEYQFPIVYNDDYTNNNAFEIDLNSLGVPLLYESDSQRTNLVEGWGTLTTPFGTFDNVLKMKTTVVNNQTITTNSGPVNNITTTVTYKWFDQAYGIPVLEVSGNVVAGSWIPTKATYIDNEQCLQPNALFGYLPLVPEFDPETGFVTVSFINTSNNYDTVSWDFGDGAFSDENNPTQTYTCPGTLQVVLTVSNVFCDPVLTSTLSLPLLISDANDDYTDEVTATATSLSADRVYDGTTYQWVDCDNDSMPIEGETNQVFEPSVSGNYAVILSTNGCESISECIEFSVLGNELFTENTMVLYPNPTKGKIYTTLNLEEIKKITVYDLYGKIVLHDLNTEHLASGVYMVTILTKDHIQKNYKIIINK